MPIVNGVITAGPRMSADIASALGVTNTNISYLCGNTHGKINPWAKYKPVIFAMNFPRSGTQGETLLKNNNGYYYWQGTFGDCGWVVKNFRTETEAINYCNGTLNGWEYRAPTGGEAAPWRQGDFIGYKHDVPKKGIGSVDLIGTTVIFNPLLSSTYALGFSDIRTIKDCHFGCLAKRRGGTGGGLRHICATSIANGGTTIELGDTSDEWIQGEGTQDEWRPHPSVSHKIPLPDGTYDIYPYLYNNSGGVYYTIPYVTGGEAGGLSAVVGGTVKPYIVAYLSNVEYDSRGYPMRATLNLTANNMTDTVSGSITLYNSSTVAGVGGRWPSPEFGKGEASYSFSGTATNGHFSWSKSIFIDALLVDGKKDCTLVAVVTNRGTTYTEVSSGGLF